MSQTSRKSSRPPILSESAEQIWLAGLGALALTEEQGARFFKTLVKKGEGFERQTRSLLDKRIASVKNVPRTAITRIEGTVEQTMAGMLHRLGIPTKREISSLTRRVESLADSFEKQARKRRNGGSRAKGGSVRTTSHPSVTLAP